MENGEQKHILLLTTGGTIASAPGEQGLAPAVSGQSLLRMMEPVAGSYRITVPGNPVSGFIQHPAGGMADYCPQRV